jgi:hypothetical protein
MMIATMEEGHRQACEVLSVASTLLTLLVIITTMHNITSKLFTLQFRTHLLIDFDLVIITITTTITKV